MRSIFKVGCCAAIVAFTYCTASAVSDEDITKTAEFIYKNNPAPVFSSIGGEWTVFSLARSGYEVDEDYYKEYYRKSEQLIKSDTFFIDHKASDYARLAIALSAIGADAENISGTNMLTVLTDHDETIAQGVNGPVWALIAFNSGEYDMADSEIENKYVEYILSCQNDDGGWSISGDGASEVDITAMAVSSLAQYKDDYDVDNSVEEAISFLSTSQNDDGTYSSYGVKNAESISQVIVALTENNISLSDERFVKNGNSATDALMMFRNDDGGFRHTLTGSGSNMMATEQALYALTAAWRAQTGRPSLFCMTDTPDISFEKSIGLPDKITAIHARERIYDTVFGDISGYKYENDISELAAYGVVNGRADGVFAPESSMTRAEFTAIIVNALCLDKIENDVFRDVTVSDWYFESVNTAYSYTIVNGIDEENFDPDGVITRQEAAVMIARAAGLCGIDTELSSDAVRNALAGFTDYREIADWAADSMAFCVNNGIIDDSEIEIEADAVIERGEMAHMVYTLLIKANLIEEL